jgi:SAM-dependent methyltransferase
MQCGDRQMTWEEAVSWLRIQPDKTELVSACYFDDPLEAAAQRFYNSLEWQSVRALLPNKPGAVLDVGAGRGIASYALSVDGWDVTALEPDASALVGAGAIATLSKLTPKPINIVQDWGETLPFEDACFDVVHARQVLHHAKDLNQFCKELIRVLRPGGMLIATREHVVDNPEGLRAFLDTHPLHSLYGGENAFTLQEYLDALASGLAPVIALSPWETPVNYFPAKYPDVRKAASRKIFWPFPALLPDWVVRRVSRRLSDPGRLYTFIGYRSQL